MNKQQLTNAVNKANEVINNVKKWTVENIEAFQSMDLKLHDAACYDYSEDYPLLQDDDNECFRWWCECQYGQFNEWLEENNIKWNDIANYIGRTSSLYLHDRNIIDFDRNNKIDIDIYTFIYNNYCGCDVMDIFTNNNIDIDLINKDNKEDVIEMLEWINTSLLNEFKALFEDTVKVYEYINDFKDNQVIYFKEELEYRNKEKEEEQKEEARDAAACKVIKDRILAIIPLDVLIMNDRQYHVIILEGAKI